MEGWLWTGPRRERVIPVGEQRAQCGDQCYGLVEHHMVAGYGNLDDGGYPAKPVVQGLAHLRGQDAVLRAEERDPAVQPRVRGQRETPLEDVRVPFPRPSPVHFA